VNVQPTAARAGLVQAVARIARVRLGDLLDNSSGTPREQRAFADLLRSNDTVTARVLETRTDGVSVLELGTTRVAIRLTTTSAPGDLVQIALDESAVDPAPAVVVKLSTPAMLIGGLQKTPLNQVLIEHVPVAPMVDTAATPQALAHALQHAVRTSGLFYEAHLRGWIDGRVALETILEEPQARVPEAPLQRTAEASDPLHAQFEPLVHPQLEPLVRQQLQAFERQSIAWHGYLWPGQQAEIVITGEPQAAADTNVARTWHVHLDLDTAGLGLLKADISLSGRLLDVRLQGQGAAVQTLRDARTALALALGAHDLDVQAIHVAAGE
jgi:hypothetical protein